MTLIASHRLTKKEALTSRPISAGNLLDRLRHLQRSQWQVGSGPWKQEAPQGKWSRTRMIRRKPCRCKSRGSVRPGQRQLERYPVILDFLPPQHPTFSFFSIHRIVHGSIELRCERNARGQYDRNL